MMKRQGSLIVSIPFKRESVFRAVCAVVVTLAVLFQFPSNGKVYSEARFCPIWTSITSTFQFPSNGKVYSEYIDVHQYSKCAESRFNSLQTGKCIQRDVVISVGFGTLIVEFPFPSNGKVYSEELEISNVVKIESFNSLQTGKCIQRSNQVSMDRLECYIVSIPFKRESVFRADLLMPYLRYEQVSIPFKRESVFRVRVLLRPYAR